MKVKIKGKKWKVIDSTYFEYRVRAKEGWNRIAVVEKGKKFWWWAVYDGNFFPYKIDTCATRKEAFDEVYSRLFILEANELIEVSGKSKKRR